MFDSIVLQIVSIGGMALVFGGLLGFSSKKFAVKTDPRVEEISLVLPNVNCGGCGFPGCAPFAAAVAEGKAAYSGCPTGGAAVAAMVAKIMGIEPGEFQRQVAFVKCHGTEGNVKKFYNYDGPDSCIAASQLATGGSKSCSYGCLGLSTCSNACGFDAISIQGGIAVIDPDKCTTCGACVAVCPKFLIEMVPEKAKVRVACASLDAGKEVRANCNTGCIGCSLCKKVCPSDAITVENNLAKIDYDKCTGCQECVVKCPTKIIKVMA